MALRRSWSIVLGALAGVGLWAYDYDFFLNAGGPQTPVSQAILSASGLQHAYWIVYVFWPLTVLTAAGVLLGLAVSAASSVVRPR